MAVNVFSTDTIESVDRNQWNNVVEQAELGQVYHRYEWLRAMEDGTDYEPRHLVASKSGNPVGVFPIFLREGDKLPVRHLYPPKPGSAGPIATTDTEEVMESFLNAVPEIGDRTVVSNKVHTAQSRFSRYNEIFRENGYEPKFDYCDFLLDITDDWETILAEMHSSRRRAVRSGHEQDFEVVDEEITEESMSAFFDSFSSVMDRVDGDEHSREFFLELTEMDDRLKLLTLRVDGGERGTILLTLDEEQSTLNYELSGITEEDFEYHPSELLHEYAIKWGQENGYETYNFGGTTGDFRDGVFRFKEKFGARPVPALSWERGCSPVVWPVYKFARGMYQRYADSRSK
jgi:hypothetical protein